MSFTPALASGARFRASTLAAYLAELRPLRTRKGLDQNLATSSTAYQDITDLSLAVAANTVYDGELMIGHKLSAGNTEDLKVTMTWPTGAEVSVGAISLDTTATSASGSAQLLYNAVYASGLTIFMAGLSTTATWSFVSFYLTTASTAGTLQVQAAQNTSGGNTCTVIAGSRLILRQGA